MAFAALRTGAFDELRWICDRRDLRQLQRLIGYFADSDMRFRQEMDIAADMSYREEAASWHDLRNHLERIAAVPYQAVYYSGRDNRSDRRGTPFLAEAFRALDVYSGQTLDIYFAPADLTPDAPGERPMYEILARSLDVTPMPGGDALLVWRTLDLIDRDGPLRPEFLRLEHFHRDARIGAVATLTLLLQAGLPLGEAVRQAWENPAHRDLDHLQDLLPGSSRSHRKAAKAWARAYAARYPERKEVDLAAKLITDLRSPSKPQRTTASAMIGAILMASGLLGAPHILTNDIPESVTVIRDLYWDLTGSTPSSEPGKAPKTEEP